MTMTTGRRVMTCDWLLCDDHLLFSDLENSQPRRGYIEGPEDYDAAPIGTVLAGMFLWSRRLVKFGPADWRWKPSGDRAMAPRGRRDVIRWGK